MKLYVFRLYLFFRYTIISKLWPYALHYTVTTLVKLKILSGRERICLSNTDRIKRILIIGPDALGDCVLFSTAMRHIRERFQNQSIAVLSRSTVKDYLLTCPYIDQVLVYDQKQLTGAAVLKDIKFFKFLRSERFDCVINALWTPTEISGFLTYITGAPIRIGCTYFQVVQARQRKGSLFTRLRTGILFTHSLEIHEEKHVFEYYLDLLRGLQIHPNPTENRPEVWSTPADRAFATDIIKNAFAKAKYLVAIAPGAGSPIRKWPAKYYAEVADYCMNHYQAMVVILGGAIDIELASQIVGTMVNTPLNLAGKATFAQIGEILKRSHLFIGNDSGPMHLAAAAGVPVVALFSSGNYIHYAPYGHGHQIIRQDLPCYPCYGRCVFQEPVCLTTITPEAVIQQIRKILKSPIDSKFVQTVENKASQQ